MHVAAGQGRSVTGSQLIRRWTDGAGADSAGRLQAWLPRAATWAMTILLAWMLAGLVWRVAGQVLQRPVEETGGLSGSAAVPDMRAAPGRTDPERWNDYTLFGKEPSAAPGALASKPATRTSEKPTAPVRLALYGTAATSAGDDALAVISVGGRPAEIYHVGDALQTGVTLAAVGPWSVTVMVGDEERVIELIEEQKLNRAVGPGPVAAASPDVGGNPAETRISSPEVVTKIQEYRQTLAANPLGLMNKVRAYAVKRDGQLYGYRLRPGTDRALLGQVGLRSGDILLSLNGLPVSDGANLPNIMAQLRDQTEMLLELERGGQKQQLRVTLETAE
jgi:general secretion pathway protein C